MVAGSIPCGVVFLQISVAVLFATSVASFLGNCCVLVSITMYASPLAVVPTIISKVEQFLVSVFDDVYFFQRPGIHRVCPHYIRSQAS